MEQEKRSRRSVGNEADTFHAKTAHTGLQNGLLLACDNAVSGVTRVYNVCIARAIRSCNFTHSDLLHHHLSSLLSSSSLSSSPPPPPPHHHYLTCIDAYVMIIVLTC